MTQKTFIVDAYSSYLPEVGETVILMESFYESTGGSHFYCMSDNGEGAGGNLNREIKRYHGWRGTSDGVGTYAHGSRKVLKVVKVGDELSDEYKVTVGKDLKPDEE